MLRSLPRRNKDIITLIGLGCFIGMRKTRLPCPFAQDRNVNTIMKPAMPMQVMNISSYACNITVVGCI